MPEKKRKPISKSKRFEVFKRDNFTCQYCGRMAPDVVLEVDHIKPVAEGGNNGLLNLITSCRDCNRGKGKRRLDDKTELKKQQTELKELAERREQMEMLIKWRDELSDMMQRQIDYIGDTIQAVTGCSLNGNGERNIKALINRFSFKEVCEAVEIAYDYYYSDGDDESWERAFSKIGGICYNRRKQSDGNL